VGEDRLTVSQLSPSKAAGYRSETADWNDGGIRPNAAPGSRTSIAVSPMRPSRKRAGSAEQASDTEPGEWEKRNLITESNQEGEVRGGGEGKKERRRVPSREGNGAASRSLTLTRRLRAKSPRVRRLERRPGPETSRGFRENIGASGEGKGSDRASTGETIGPGMPYNGDNVSLSCFFPGWASI
jgi:hypothetical protein